MDREREVLRGFDLAAAGGAGGDGGDGGARVAPCALVASSATAGLGWMLFTLGAAELLGAALSASTPSFGEISNSFDWTPAIRRTIRAAPPNIKFRMGAVRIALWRNCSARSITAPECAFDPVCPTLPVPILPVLIGLIPLDLVPFDLVSRLSAARMDVVVEPASKTCCSWRTSSANSEPRW